MRRYPLQAGRHLRAAACTRGWRAAQLALLAWLLTACVGVPVPDVSGQASLGRVAIIASNELPQIEFRGMAAGKGQGAALTGGVTFLGCVGVMSGATCAGPFCGPMVALWVGVCGTAAATAGVAGAIATPSARQQKRDQQRLQDAFSAVKLQETLRVRAVEAARARGIALTETVPEADAQTVVANADAAAAIAPDMLATLAAQGFDIVLETRVTALGADGAAIASPLTAYMTAEVSLWRTRDGKLIDRFELRWRGDRLPREEWLADGGRRLLDALSRGYVALADALVDRTFLLYPLPDRRAHMRGGVAAFFGLAPIAPPVLTQLPDETLGSRLAWQYTDTLQPVLEWQAFPRESDVQRQPADMARVRNVRYDLVVALAHNDVPAEIVYRREGIGSPSHRIETPLAPGARYFWSVRARFTLDGRERVSEWSAMDYRSFGKFTAPSANSYRFRVPATD